MNRGDIAIVNLTVMDSRNKKYFLENIIFSIPYDSDRDVLKINDFEDRRIIQKFKLSEDLKIIKTEVVQKLGKKTKTMSFYGNN